MRRSFLMTGVVALTVFLILVLSAAYFALGTGQKPASSTTNTGPSRSSSKSSVSTPSGTSLTSSSTTGTTTTSTQQASVTTVNVIIIHGVASKGSGAGYSPDNITLIIGVNNTVTWTNNDTSPHTAIAMSGIFNSNNLAPGQSYTFIFTAPGTYVYFCAYHGWMHGMVVVKPKS